MDQTQDDLKTSIYSDDEKGKSPSVVVKRDPTEEELPDLFEHVANELGFVCTILDEESLDQLAPMGESWEWEIYQQDYFACPSWYIANKPRQTGVSAAFSAKTFARSNLSPRNYTGIFVSYKRQEAINKIRYVKQFLEALPVPFRKKITRDALSLIEWENSNGTVSKIISHPQRPVRGHHGDVILDEIGFYIEDYLIYESALPAVIQVNGNIDMTSTPWGKSGLFFDVLTMPERYPKFTRRWIYWWWCKRYLKEQTDEFLMKAMLEAKFLTTEERVYLYGNEKIKIQFENLPLEIFQQEFEGMFIDEASSFFSKEKIIGVMFDNEDSISGYNPRETDFEMPVEEALRTNDWPIVREHKSNVSFKKYDTLEALYSAIDRGEVSLNLYGGADIGTTRHSTHFTILEEILFPDGKTFQVERFSLNKTGWDLDDQQNFFSLILQKGILRKFCIDGQGIGMQMSQSFEKNFPRVTKVFRASGNNSVTEDLMTNLYDRIQNRKIALAYEKQTVEDLHSVKGIVGANRKLSFRTDERRKHHGDSAWAIAMASFGGTMSGATVSNAKLMSKDVIKDLSGGLRSYKSLVSEFKSADLIKTMDPGRFIKRWED